MTRAFQPRRRLCRWPGVLVLALCCAGCAEIGFSNNAPWPRVSARHIAYPQPELRAFGTVYFGFDSATLATDGQRLADALANRLGRYPDDRVRLEGHSSNVGDAAYNRALAQRRVDAVKQYLVGREIEPERIDAVSFGESEPVAPADAIHQELNRRVEVILIVARGR